MPVGTGSINRAAKTSKKAVETVVEAPVKLAEKTPVRTTVKTEGANNNASTAVKAEEMKKEVSPKKATTKKSTASKKTQKPELTVYADETVFVVANECCQLTQELPIYLL